MQENILNKYYIAQLTKITKEVKKMKKTQLLLISIIVILLMACTATTNPLSSEIDQDQENDNGITILFNTSGVNDNG